MAKKKSTGAGQIIPERIMDWSGGQNNAVNVALLNDNESRLLQNYSLDEKGTLFPFPGSLKRYTANLGASPVAGMGKYYKSDGTSRFLIGLEDGKLYVDSPHLVNQYDTQAEFNGGGNFAVQADAGGKLWPMIITDGFESGLFDDWHTHDSGWTIDSTVFKTGAKSAKGTGTTQKLIREFGFNAGQVYIKMAVRFAEANQLHYPVIFKSPTDTEIQAVVADSDGNFKYHNGTALTAFPTAKTYAADTWYVVEVWVRGGTFWVSIDGASLTPSGLTMKDTANAAQTQASKLQIQNAGATSATTYIDDIEINLLAPVPSRASVAYKQDGTQAAANQPRYEYMALPAPAVWQDLFDTDQLAAQYTSGGDVAATWAVSGGVLTGTGGTYATLIKNNLLLQDCEIEVNTSQGSSGGLVARHQDNSNYYYLVLNDDTTHPTANVRLFKRVGGSPIGLVDVDVNWPRGTSKKVRLALHGNRIEVFFNNIKVISIIDSSFTGGSVGFFAHGSNSIYQDFAVYQAVQGVMSEEACTNIIATWPTGWTVAGDVGMAAVDQGVQPGAALSTVRLTNSGTTEGFYNSPAFALIPSTTYTLRFKMRGTVATSPIEAEVFVISNTGTYVQTAQAPPLNATFRVFEYTFTTTADISGTNQQIRFDHNGSDAGYIEIAEVSIIQKAYALTFPGYGATRAAEVLTVPSSVFNKGNWTVKLKFTPTSSQVIAGRYAYLFRIFIDANNYYQLIIFPTGQTLLQVVSGGTIYSITDTVALVPGQSYFYSASGNGSVIRLCRNGVQIGSDLTYAEPVGTLPASMYVGSNQAGGEQANGIFSDFAVLNQPETLAQHQADYNTGLPLTVTDATTLLMSANGKLDVSASHHWITPVIDCSNATNKASGHAALTATTPGTSTVAIASRSAPANTGPWTAWVAALGDGTLQHTADNYVQVRLTLTRSGENDPYIDKLTVSFDGQATATLLASDFSAGKQFFFDQLNDLLAVMTGDAPRKYDGTTLAAMGGSPPHAPYGVAHKNRFWMAKGSRLYFSDLLNVESWPVLNFIDIMPNDGDTITGMITFGDYLVIAKGHSVWMLIGETINTFRVRRIHSDRGCYAPRSLCIVNQMLCFVSDDGIYFSDFTQPVLISERIRKTWDGLNKRRLNLVASWFFDHKLYVAVPDAGQQRNNRVLVYDSLRQAFAGDRIWPVSCWTDFREAGDINSFFGRSDLGNVRKINTGYNDDGATYEAIYESKAISHGAAEILKRYNIGYLQVKPAALDAELIISFIVDGVETPTMTVTVPANATGLIDTLQIFASEVGVVSGHRIQVKIRQQVLDNPLGIQSVYLEALPLLIAPTLRG